MSAKREPLLSMTVERAAHALRAGMPALQLGLKRFPFLVFVSFGFLGDVVLPLRHGIPRGHILKNQFRARMYVGWISIRIRRDYKPLAAQFFFPATVGILGSPPLVR